MSFKKIVSFLLVCTSILILSCKAGKIEKQNGADLERLLSWMTGYFSSQEQAEADSEFVDVRLRTVQIWPDRTDGKWIYIEQAVSNSLHRPYRQQIYRVTQIDNGSYQITTFSFKNPLRFKGEWKKERPMAHMSPDSLIAADGCSVMLKKQGDEAFVGGTVGKNCADSFLGASYAVSEVTITDTEMTSWDRGYDIHNKQVWGSEKGGYIFKKIEDDQ